MKIKDIKYLVSWIALFAGVAIVFASSILYMNINESGFWEALFQTIYGISLSICGTLILFSIIYFMFERKGFHINNFCKYDNEKLKEFSYVAYRRLFDADWDNRILNSKDIVIFVYYWGGWLITHKDSFVEFLKKGGRLTIILPDIKNNDLLRDIRKYFFKTTLKDENDLLDKICHTIESLRFLKRTSKNESSDIEVRLYNDIQNYSFVLFDNRYLYISPYEQIRKPIVEVPVLSIDLYSNESVRSYWEEEIGEILKQTTFLESF